MGLRCRPNRDRLHLSFLTAAVVLASGFACAEAQTQPAADSDRAMDLMIESGRAGVMLDQSDQAMKALNPKPTEDEVDTAQQQIAYSAHSLRSTVLRFGELQMTACRAGTVGGELCRPYVPSWLNEPLDTVPAPDLLRARQNEATAHIQPFWQALCSQVITKTDNQDFCAIE